ncbi:MAG: amidase domain-containing protein [Patescibacteria group bacterium]|nr:amidase domain-containing protein [Patescibacteria group bacterium]
MKVKKVVLVMLVLAIIASSTGIASAYIYNRQTTVNYAIANGEKNVPGSWYFNTGGGDCTNFVSHSLKAGGWTQRKTGMIWYYDSYLWRQYSNSWTSVEQFRDFVILSGRGREIPFSRSDVWTRPTQFTVGDVMQADWTSDGKWDHSMIITKIDGTDVYVTYHSNNRVNKKVSDLIREQPEIQFRVLLLKDTHNY